LGFHHCVPSPQLMKLHEQYLAQESELRKQAEKGRTEALRLLERIADMAPSSEGAAIIITVVKAFLEERRR
jgi:hypothetical protein